MPKGRGNHVPKPPKPPVMPRSSKSISAEAQRLTRQAEKASNSPLFSANKGIARKPTTPPVPKNPRKVK